MNFEQEDYWPAKPKTTVTFVDVVAFFMIAALTTVCLVGAVCALIGVRVNL